MKIVRWFAGSWLSRIYLALVAVVTVWTVVSISTGNVPDYSHPDIVPSALTLPVSLTLLGLFEVVFGLFETGDDLWLWVGCVVVGALVNAAALNGVVAVAKRLMAKLRSAGPAGAGRGPRADKPGALKDS